MPRQETATLRRLRVKIEQLTSLVQFEEIIDTMPEEHRRRGRKILEPMLRPGLPCCGVAALNRAMGGLEKKHAPRCPKAHLVVLATHIPSTLEPSR